MHRSTFWAAPILMFSSEMSLHDIPALMSPRCIAALQTPQVSFVGKQEKSVRRPDRRAQKAAIAVRRAIHQETLIRVGVSPKPTTGLEWDPALKTEVTRLEYAGLVRWDYVEPNPAVNERSTRTSLESLPAACP